jgi:hypothetical protein
MAAGQLVARIKDTTFHREVYEPAEVRAPTRLRPAR